jgi:Na+/phosphate symporter
MAFAGQGSRRRTLRYLHPGANPHGTEPAAESGVGAIRRQAPDYKLVNRVVAAPWPVLLKWIGPALITLDPNPTRAVADFHTGFNIVLALLFFPLLNPFARLLVRLLPARVDTADPALPIYLDWAARETPSIALAGAAREALRMVDVFEAMLRGALDSLNRGDRKRVSETARMDTVLDRLDTAIKEYLASIDSDALDDTDHRRLSEILAFTTNLEHAGGHRREEPNAARGQTHQVRRQLLGNQPGGDPRDDRPADQQRAGRRGRVHDRRPAGGPPAARRKGGLSGT